MKLLIVFFFSFRTNYEFPNDDNLSNYNYLTLEYDFEEKTDDRARKKKKINVKMSSHTQWIDIDFTFFLRQTIFSIRLQWHSDIYFYLFVI